MAKVRHSKTSGGVPALVGFLGVLVLIGYIVTVLAAGGSIEIAGALAAAVGVLRVVPAIIRALRGDHPK